MPRPCSSCCPDGFPVFACPRSSSCRGNSGGPATGATAAKGGQLPAGLLQLRELLRALKRWQHQGRDREERQLPLGFLFLRQLLRQQPL